MNRSIKLLFDKNDINISFAQVVINQPVQKGPVAVSEDVEAQARQFVNERKELSKGLKEEEQNIK